MPIHGWRQTLTAVVLLLPLLALAVIMVRGSRSADVPNLKAPNGAPAALPPPTTLGDLSKISLAAVRGTTTTVAVRTTGNSTLAGLVSGPAGPVPAATVHIERLTARHPSTWAPVLTGATCSPASLAARTGSGRSSRRRPRRPRRACCSSPTGRRRRPI